MTHRLVSFDFDDTLLLTKFDEDWGTLPAGPNHPMIERFRAHLEAGDTLIIVTTRKDGDAQEVHAFLEEHGLPVSAVHCTNGKDKAETLIALGVDIHHDDDPHELKLLPNSILGIKAPIHESWTYVLQQRGTTWD